MSDLNQAVRQVRRSPGKVAAAVVTIGLGIGAVCTVLSVLDSVVLAPLPFVEPERLIFLNETTPQGGRFSTSDPNYLEYAEAGSFSAAAAVRGPAKTWTLAAGSEPERRRGFPVTPSFFGVLELEPMLGRTFSEDEAGPENRVCILSYDLWRDSFAGDRGIVGRDIVLDGEKWTVVGVLPALPASFGNVWGALAADLWTPYAARPESNRSDHRLQVVVRLAPGVTLAAARAEAEAVAARLATAYPDSNEGWGVRLTTLREGLLGDGTEVTWVLVLAVSLLLLLAVANVANLLLAQASTRQREVGLRFALGASQSRILRQFLTESVLIAGLGTLLGLGLALAALPLVRSMDALPRINAAAVNPRVLAMTVLVTALTAVLVGLAPGLHVRQRRLGEVLRDGGRSSRSNRLRNLLVVAEVALATLLVLSAGLLVRSFLNLRTADLGYDPDEILVVSLALPGVNQPDAPLRVGAAYREIVDTVAATPEVEAAGATSGTFLGGGGFRIQAAAEGAAEVEDFVRCQWRSVTAGFFQTLNLALLDGRLFDERDQFLEETGLRDAEARIPAIVNAEMAQRLWGTLHVAGRRFHWDRPGGALIEVAGVVGNAQDVAVEIGPLPTIYFFHQQAPFLEMTLLARTDGDPEAAAAAVGRAIREARKDIPVPPVEPLGKRFAASITTPRHTTAVMTVFATLALVLAATGIYAVVSFQVASRRHEIGIRMALGARRATLVAMIVRRGTTLIAGGMALGTLGAFAFARVLESFLYETAPNDAKTCLSVAVLLAAVGVLASYAAAARAVAVEPRAILADE